MGTKMDPSYASVFMGSIEDQCLRSSGSTPIEDQPYIWIWYIDDMFFIWLTAQGENKFIEFLNKLNSFHPTIKFVSSHSTQKIIFLDTIPFILTMIRTLNPKSILNQDNRLLASPTPSILPPPSCKMGLVYSQILRFRRIISEGHKFLMRAVERLRVICTRL